MGKIREIVCWCGTNVLYLQSWGLALCSIRFHKAPFDQAPMPFLWHIFIFLFKLLNHVGWSDFSRIVFAQVKDDVMHHEWEGYADGIGELRNTENSGKFWKWLDWHCDISNNILCLIIIWVHVPVSLPEGKLPYHVLVILTYVSLIKTKRNVE